MEPQANNPQPAPQPAPAPASDAPKHNTAMAVLSYIGPLVIISYLTAKDDAFVKYHIKQGLVLLVAEVALWVIGSVSYMLWHIIQVIHIAVVILAVIGIINAINGKEKELPFVGKLGANFKI